MEIASLVVPIAFLLATPIGCKWLLKPQQPAESTDARTSVVEDEPRAEYRTAVSA